MAKQPVKSGLSSVAAAGIDIAGATLKAMGDQQQAAIRRRPGCGFGRVFGPLDDQFRQPRVQAKRGKQMRRSRAGKMQHGLQQALAKGHAVAHHEGQKINRPVFGAVQGFRQRRSAVQHRRLDPRKRTLSGQSRRQGMQGGIAGRRARAVADNDQQAVPNGMFRPTG